MPKQITGIVTSNKQDKTIVIVSHNRKTHPIYKKQYPVSKKYMAHDPKNEAQIGDRVIISETRPLSARKHFILTKITSKNIIEAESLEIIKVPDSNKRTSKKSEVKKDKE